MEVMQKPCIDSLGKSKPKETKWVTFPYRLFFAREHTTTWGPGAVAFVHPESNSDRKAYLCIYTITLFCTFSKLLLFLSFQIVHQMHAGTIFQGGCQGTNPECSMGVAVR